MSNHEPPDGETRMLRFEGRGITLARGSEVWVGRAEDGSGILRFKNKEGTVTKIGLSAAAMDALKELMSDDDSRFEWRVVTEGVVMVKDEPHE